MKNQIKKPRALPMQLLIIVIALMISSAVTACASNSQTKQENKEENEDITTGIIIEKEDYVLSNPKGFSSEVYIFTIKSDDNRTREIRVTSVTYQNYNTGDHFDAKNHVKK